MWGLATYPSRTNIVVEKWVRNLALMFNFGRKASIVSNAVNRRKKKTDYMCNLLYSIIGYEKDTFPVSKLYDCTLVEFEDSQFFAFTDYDYFLSQWYGDYMKLPPIEQQVTHHTFSVFWKD
jgi:lipopolysaccharide cholinephosphotransferase